MSTIALDISAFRAAFPAFADPLAYPDAFITIQWGMATGFVSDDTYGYMPVAARTAALQYQLAHLLALGDIIKNGGNYQGTPGLIQQSKVGDIAVTLHPPPYGTSAWRYWLMLTPYGTQLIALLDVQAVGGFIVGGLPERAAFRKVAGVF